MSSDLVAFLQRLLHEPAVLVTVRSTRGSAPRESGAWMAVFRDGQTGSVGGGQLEWDALHQARLRLSTADAAAGGGATGASALSWTRQWALGPSLGQCCGGQVELQFEVVTAADRPALQQRLGVGLAPVALFGGGHVGRALVQALAPLPFAVTWIDSRDEVFPALLPDTVRVEHSDPVQAGVRDLPAGASVLIMSFSHAEDLDIVAACLQRQRERNDLPWVGLIGSRTKWATFRHRLGARGFSDAELDRITCPIGLPGIVGKAPAVIAASVVAQLLLATAPLRSP